MLNPQESNVTLNTFLINFREKEKRIFWKQKKNQEVLNKSLYGEYLCA